MLIRKLVMNTVAKSSKPINPMAHVLRHRDYRLLWLGQATSLIGDQFAMIAPARSLSSCQ